MKSIDFTYFFLFMIAMISLYYKTICGGVFNEKASHVFQVAAVKNKKKFNNCFIIIIIF